MRSNLARHLGIHPGIFDTFKDEDGRRAPLSGAIAKAHLAKADELLARPSQVEMLHILAAKACYVARPLSRSLWGRNL